MKGFLAFLILTCAVISGAADKPNIVLILTDDVGLGDIGCCGGPFKTPQIDALAKSGMRFENCYKRLTKNWRYPETRLMWGR